MSAKINLLESHQSPEENPARRVKKSVAQMLVRKALAEWVGKVAIRMRPLKDFAAGPEKSAAVIRYREIFNYDYPANDFPQRTFWGEPLILSYPIADQRSNPAY